MPLGKRPVLDHLIEGLSHAEGVDAVILATSTENDDDLTAAFASARGLACYRGPQDDVARRLLNAAEELGADAVVRVNGDSPFLDPALIAYGVDLFRQTLPDIVTNVFPRSFPKGQSVEVVSMDALRNTVRDMETSDEKEHVTKHIYAHPDRYDIRNFTCPDPCPDIQLSIDEAADLSRSQEILRILGGTAPWQVGWSGCVAAYRQCNKGESSNIGRT